MKSNFSVYEPTCLRRYYPSTQFVGAGSSWRRDSGDPRLPGQSSSGDPWTGDFKRSRYPLIETNETYPVLGTANPDTAQNYLHSSTLGSRKLPQSLVRPQTKSFQHTWVEHLYFSVMMETESGLPKKLCWNCMASLISPSHTCPGLH